MLDEATEKDKKAEKELDDLDAGSNSPSAGKSSYIFWRANHTAENGRKKSHVMHYN